MQNILLIDDDDRLAALLQQYFERHNLALTTATRPSDGLATLAADPFDLVILDIMLPKMDGFEVCRTIRKQSDIPILMLYSTRRRHGSCGRPGAGCRRLSAKTL